ncbi:transposable element Tc1 transposase [Trichonephila clavipes]|nr:transposable element Tc1 transposase [Trichonephila clavipes]
MDLPPYSPDLNPIEHVWDALGRRIAACLYHPENTQQLKQMLIEEWVLLLQEMLHLLVLSIWRRCEATIAKDNLSVHHSATGKHLHVSNKGHPLQRDIQRRYNSWQVALLSPSVELLHHVQTVLPVDHDNYPPTGSNL